MRERHVSWTGLDDGAVRTLTAKNVILHGRAVKAGGSSCWPGQFRPSADSRSVGLRGRWGNRASAARQRAGESYHLIASERRDSLALSVRVMRIIGLEGLSRAIAMVKILMVTGDAGEAQEIYYAKFRLEEEGWQVQIAAPEKRVFLSVVHDFEPGFDTYTEKPGYRVTADLALDDVAPEEFDGLVLARRPSARVPAKPAEGRLDRATLPGSPEADRGQLSRAVAASGGRRRQRHDHDVLSRSSSWICGLAECEFVNRDVVVDGPLVTVRGWPDNGPWMREFVRLLKGAK